MHLFLLYLKYRSERYDMKDFDSLTPKHPNMKWFLMALKRYADFNGRSRRSEFWYFTLFNFLIAIVVALVCNAIQFTIPYLLYCLATFIPSIAVAVRRMHDVNKSGWFILIPIYNLILYCTDGTQGPNQYGHDPKRPEFEEFLSDADPAQS
jgi:uncharacterized membrane protein YhaH (DUF805 family)